MTNTRSDWEQRFQSLTIEGRAFIDGQYCPALSGDTFECVSPVDGRFLANVASTDEADANAAVDRAHAFKGVAAECRAVLAVDECAAFDC